MRDYVSAAIVAMVIGAIAGGEMILSRVDVPTGEASVAAHTLPAPAQALISAAAAQPHPIVESAMDSGAPDRLGAAVFKSSINPKIVEPAAITPPTEVGPNDASVKVATPPSAVAAPARPRFAVLRVTQSGQLSGEAMALGAGAGARLTRTNGTPQGNSIGG